MFQLASWAGVQPIIGIATRQQYGSAGLLAPGAHTTHALHSQLCRQPTKQLRTALVEHLGLAGLAYPVIRTCSSLRWLLGRPYEKAGFPSDGSCAGA